MSNNIKNNLIVEHSGGQKEKKRPPLFCENCQAHNAKHICINMGGDKYILCPRCLKILEELEREYNDIIALPISCHQILHEQPCQP